MKEKGSCGSCLVKIKNLGVSLSGMSVLNNVNLNLHCGELTSIIGPNGAGKTTLLKALLGEIPFTGNISFYDANLNIVHFPKVGYVPQKVAFDKSSPISVSDLFSAGRRKAPVFLPFAAKKDERLDELLELVSAKHLLNRKIGNLSGGELQRVLLAFALYPEIPDLLILDEPVTGVDLTGQDMFYNLLHHLLSEFHTSILLVSHDFNLVRRHADNVCLIQNSVKAFGAPDMVFKSSAFKRLFTLE